ncbi:MAG: hypothetical protein HGA37_13645 [Lentimicrobium sp.]|nr:hypothetical protein [Lentimicrobium sp.]
MTEYNPPIESRENDELIIISFCSTDEWQQDAIDQAVRELEKRGITKDLRKKRMFELESLYEAELKQELEIRRTEDFTIIEKFFLVLWWPREIFSGWSLRKEGYILKAKRRLQLIGLGIVLTVMLFAWADYQWDINNQKLIEEIEKTDISEWEKNHVADTTTDEQHIKDTIEKKNAL